MEITWRDKTITCEEGTTLFDISKQVEKEYEFPIIVAKVDGVIQELYHEVIDGTTVSFCTTKDSDGTWYVNAFAEGNSGRKGI